MGHHFIDLDPNHTSLKELNLFVHHASDLVSFDYQLYNYPLFSGNFLKVFLKIVKLLGLLITITIT